MKTKKKKRLGAPGRKRRHVDFAEIARLMGR